MIVRLAAAFAALLISALFATTEVYAATATQYPGGKYSPPPEKYGMSVVPDVPIKVDDGTTLRADIVYPTDLATGKRADGKFPVLLSQDIYSFKPQTPIPPAMANSPYAGLVMPWRYFVPRGYIFVHLNVRGTGGSEGVLDLHGKRSGLDGVFVSYWVANPANVSGANGVVGLEGCSALGIVQINTLSRMGELQRLGKLDPKTNPVKASVAKCLSGDEYHDLLFDNGIPTVIWNGIPPGPTPSGFNTPGVLTGGDMAYHRADFWTERDRVVQADDIARTGVPILITGGWKEAALIGVPELYAALQNAAAGRPYLGPMAGDQHTSPKYQVILGDWGHGGGLDRGMEAEWFDTWLNGVDTGMQKAKTTLHEKELPSDRTARWVNVQTYPYGAPATQYFFAADALEPAAPAHAASNQVAWGQGQSVSYTLSKPYDRDMTVVGPSAVTVWATTSNADIQLLAQLKDVAPDGSATEITHASILGSMRDEDPARSWSSSNGLVVRPYLKDLTGAAVTPGQPVKLDIPLQPTLWRLLAGHRLQLVLYSQTPRDMCDRAAKAVAPAPLGCWWSAPMVFNLAGGQYQILQGADHPSSLVLTIVPSDSLPTAQSSVTPTSMNVAQPLGW